MLSFQQVAIFFAGGGPRLDVGGCRLIGVPLAEARGGLAISHSKVCRRSGFSVLGDAL